jgi:hypothetical protein
MTHSDHMEHIANVLSYIRKAKKVDRKLRYLEKHKSEDLLKILWYAYNPLITYNLSGEDLDNYDGTISDYLECNEIFELFDVSMRRCINKTESMCGVVLSLKEIYPQEVFDMVKQVFSKDLGLGLSIEDINDVFGLRHWMKWFIPESYNDYNAKKYQDKHKPNKYKMVA